MFEEKSYNPFKMWGSLIGAVMGIVFSLFGWYSVGIFNLIFKVNILEQSRLIIYSVVYGFWTIVGFLIGWGIHSLIRRFKTS